MAKGNFINYIVSNDPNEYPSDGEHGGYYYQKFDSSTLIPANIRQGVNIFGIDGELEELVTIDGKKVTESMSLKSFFHKNKNMETLPYSCRNFTAGIYNN